MKHNPLGFVVLLITWCQKRRTYAALFGHIFNGIVTGMCVYLLFENSQLKLQYGYLARRGFSNLDLEDLA